MLLLLVFGALLCAPTSGISDKPNLIFIMVDDWGWYNAGFSGNPLANTPVVDDLVKSQGARFERHYAYKFCSPTRRSFLSGRVPPHSGQDNSAGATVDLRMKTIADKMQEAGYVTGYSGKWHAGHSIMAQIPLNRGFNTSLGYFNGACDHWKQTDGEDGCHQDASTGFGSAGSTTDLWDTDKPGFGLNGTYGDYLYTGRAVETIEKHDHSSPLFYYLALQCAHEPMEAPQRFLDLYDKSIVPNQVEYAFSAVIDEAVGNVTKALHANGMWGNTLMVVVADNGGPSFSDQHAASNFPLRGGKYTYFEGGIRTNGFVTGGLLPSKLHGKNISSPIHVSDWYSTFSHLAGVDPADDHQGVPSIDSVNLWPLLNGSTQDAEREIFIGSGVLIQGKWKLIATGAGFSAQWSGPMYPKVPATGPQHIHCQEQTPCLFDVVSDPSEHNEVAAQNPDVVQSMQARLAVLNKGVFEGLQPKVAKGAVCDATAKNKNFLTPSDYHH